MKVIVAGAGETGATLAASFSQANWDVVLMDRDAAALQEAEETLDVMTLVGDSTHRGVLRRAGAASADAFVAVARLDSDNLLAASFAKELGARVAVARADDPDFFRGTDFVETDLLGIDATFCAPRLAAADVLERIIGSHLDFVASYCGYGVRVGILPMERTPELVGKRPSVLNLPEGVALRAILRDGYVRNGSDVARLEPTDRLLLSGSPEGVLRAWAELVPTVAEERALIAGATDLGIEVARQLAPLLDRVELVDKDRGRAEALARTLSDVTVMVGDARRASFLTDLQLGSVSYAVAATAMDETSLLISLLARTHGARHSYAILRQPGHSELFRAAGVGGATGIFEVLGRAISEAISGSGEIRRDAVPGTAYSILEWRIGGSRKRQGHTTLDRLSLPAQAILLAVAHRYRSLPLASGTELTAGDSVVVLAPSDQLDELKSNLARTDKALAK